MLTEGNLVVQVRTANIQDRAGAAQALAETHTLCPMVTRGWAGLLGARRGAAMPKEFTI
jgi:hypothetical protein